MIPFQPETSPRPVPIPEGWNMVRQDDIISHLDKVYIDGSWVASMVPPGARYRLSMGPMMTPAKSSSEPESVKVLHECAELQLRKSRDYQNPNSRIQQADYYPSGVKTLLEIITAKALRAQSVIEAMENDPAYEPNFESVEDSFKDMINYASFAVSYCRGKIDGQDPTRDFLNRRKAA